MQHKKNVKSKEYDDYSHYSDENFGNYNEEEKDEDFADQLKQYRQAKETSSTDLGPPFPKEPVKKQGMKGIQKGKIIWIVNCSNGGGSSCIMHHFRMFVLRAEWRKLPAVAFLRACSLPSVSDKAAHREGIISYGCTDAYIEEKDQVSGNMYVENKQIKPY